MGKMKDFFKRKSIKTVFTISMLACIFSALLLSLALSNFCQWGQSRYYKKYQIQFGVSNPEMVIGFEKTEGNISYQTPLNLKDHFTRTDRTVYNILGFLSVGVYPICFIFCIAVTSVLFYKRQLQEPITILDHAAGKIAENNLDFKIIYDKEDELGKLCVSFEKMRQALQESNEEMWRQMEERKRLNAAFAHDLRTPLTVLKGQSELLRKYAPKMTAEKVSDTSKMMYRHIVRLEEYVQTMGELQRLEDIMIVRQPVTMYALCRQFRETGEAVCNGKTFFCEVIGDEHVDLNIDTTIVMRVFENLLANAVRFAKEKIKVLTKLQDGYLYLTVSDDGAGFAEKDLENATKPFYKTVRETDNEHFGMGLNICKILCEKHGGYIRLSNQDGAVITVAFRQ